MVLVLKWKIFQLYYFQQYRPGKYLLRYSSSKNTPFQIIKTRSSKSRKTDILLNGLTHRFGPKIVNFPTFFFQQYRSGKYHLRYFSTKKTPFQAIKTINSKRKKVDIFPKGLTHGFGPKMVNFPIFFFLAIQARKISFTIFQHEKTPFQTIKTRSSKSRKIDIFYKVLVKKWSIFHLFFLAIQVRIISFTISQHEKSPFQAIQTTSSKRQKIHIFPKKKLTHGFGPKMAIFQLFFRQYRPEKSLLRYFSTKNHLSRL